MMMLLQQRSYSYAAFDVDANNAPLGICDVHLALPMHCCHNISLQLSCAKSQASELSMRRIGSGVHYAARVRH
jgi:hypothetical protein